MYFILIHIVNVDYHVLPLFKCLTNQMVYDLRCTKPRVWWCSLQLISV